MKKVVICAAALCLVVSGANFAQTPQANGPVYVSEPSVPILTPAVRDLPEFVPDPNLFGLEAKRRDDHGIVVPDIDMPPHDNPLAEMQTRAPGPQPDGFTTPLVNFPGVTSSSSPPDDTGDVGPTHFVQGDNGPGGSRATIYTKTGTQVAQFLMETLGAAPCNSGYCDPIVQYDELADRWMISEFDSSANVLCVYVSQTPDPTGAWYAYSFNMTAFGGMQDYPKYGIWPDGYYIGVNNGGYVHVLDRVRMLAGLPATSQTKTLPTLPGFGFQLTIPGTLEGDPPPAGAPAILARPVDTEVHSGYTCSSPPCDVMDLWAFHVDWGTPANTTLTQLPGVRMAEFDHTLCGTGSTWNCMPQAGTTQMIDPIREPIHFPLQYRNWGSYETLVGAFAEDVDGTDHAAVHWFEVRKVSGTWAMYQEGVLGGEANVHRSIAGAAMDSSGNIAVGYTRTGNSLYPSIYYSGRLATDPLNTMPYYDNMIFDATTSKTDNERYGDYAGIGVDPVDDCTFWFTTEYGGSGQTRIASFKFDACGCLSVPNAPTTSAMATAPNQIDVDWNDSATITITQYYVFRSTVSGGPYTQIATVPDTSPGTGGGAPYTYQDLTVSGGTTYYYVVKSNDGVSCTSANSNEASALATGACTLSPAFAGLTSVTNPAGATCTLNLSWSAGTASCAGPLRYSVYRATTPGFIPAVGNRIASNLDATAYSDLDNLVSGTTYYYVVRATDTSNSAEETNMVERSGAPSGPGSGTATYPSTDVPKTITDNATVTSTIVISGANTIADINVTIGNITHTYDGDLDIFLIAPNATRVELSTDNGGGGDNFVNTVFDDTAATAITAGAAPFTGSFRPEGSLSTLNGISANGTWILEITDDAGGDVGALTAWSLSIATMNPCATGSACANNPSLVNVSPDGPLTLCAGTGQLLTAGVTGGTGIAYQWYEDAVAISGAVASTYTANATGTHTYNCKVTGSGCPTGLSDAAPVSITWQSAPSFAGLGSVVNPQAATCTLDLSWSAASSACPGTITYKIYRSTTTPVSIIPGNLIASGLTATTYSDTGNLATGTTYYYVVRAVDGASQEDANAVERWGAPTGVGGGSTTFLSESFSGGIPGTWTVVDGGAGGGAAATWTTANPGGRTGVAPITTPFAIVDSDNAGSAASQDEQLITPVVNLSTASTASVEFDHYFFRYQAEICDVDVRSSMTGGAWTNVARWTGASTTNPLHSTLDITAQAAGAADVQVRFWYYSATYEWYWILDNVIVRGMVNSPCTSLPAAPGEVASTPDGTAGTTQLWTSQTDQSWPATAGATGYNLYRGVLADLTNGNILNATVDSCYRYQGAGTTASNLTDDPSAVAGGFYWYLVTGVNGGGEGPAGNATTAPRMVNATVTCP